MCPLLQDIVASITTYPLADSYTMRNELEADSQRKVTGLMSKTKKQITGMMKSYEDEERLCPVTVRFPSGVWEAISRISADRSCSMADLVRLVVEWGLQGMEEHTLKEKQISELRDAIIQLTDEISQVQRELNRIGVNYNQEIKIKNIERKYSNRKNLDERASYFREMEVVKKENTTLNKDELDSLMSRYEEATKVAGETICRILG